MASVYLNGDFLLLENARISVLDRGFLFGDGVYEVIPAYGGRLFRLSHHLRRLQGSLDGIRLHNPLDNQQWESILNELLERNQNPDNRLADQAVYLQVTRGVAAKRDHRFPPTVTPTVYANSFPLTAPDPQIAQQGIAAITLDDIRWQYCNIKAITLLPNVLLRQQAEEHDASEALLIRDDFVLEGSASNVFVVKDGVICTPPKGPQILPGITRDLVIELAAQHQLPHEVRNIRASELDSADEIWVTSSTREINPVTRLDGRSIGDGKPGPVWETMIRHFRTYKDAVRRGTAA